MILQLTLAASLFLASGELTPPFRVDAPETEFQAKPPADLSFSTWGLKIVLGLGFVVAMIYLMGRFVAPKVLRLAPNNTQKLRVLERLALDAKHALYMVECEGRERFLIGVSEQNITALAQLKKQSAEIEVVDDFKAQAS